MKPIKQNVYGDGHTDGHTCIDINNNLTGVPCAACKQESELRCAECRVEIDPEVDHRIPAGESTSGQELWLCEVCAID